MKIYYTGSHSVGKSTIAKYTSETFKIPLLTEVARTVLAERELNVNNMRSDITLVNSYQQEVFYRQISEEIKMKDFFVADRGLLDCVAYSIQHSNIANKLVSSDDFSKYIKNLHIFCQAI